MEISFLNNKTVLIFCNRECDKNPKMLLIRILDRRMKGIRETVNEDRSDELENKQNERTKRSETQTVLECKLRDVATVINVN